MAVTARRGGKARKRGRRGFWLAAALVALALLFFWMRVSAMTVHVRRTDVYLRDLPASFDGTTVLYIADVDILSQASLRDTRGLMRRLQALRPDALLLGGDYTSDSLLRILNRVSQDAAPDDASLERRSIFFASLASFSAPLGKFAVLARDEPSPESVKEYMSAGGVRLLRDETVPLNRGADRIYLCGLDAPGESGSQLSALSGRLSSSDCVIAFAHSSSALPSLQIAEAGDGGGWVDLALFGATHGGQIRLGRRCLISLSAREQQYLSGWYAENGVKLLVSQGLGCEGVRLRLGTQAEVHLLTLRRGDAPGGNGWQ